MSEEEPEIKYVQMGVGDDISLEDTNTLLTMGSNVVGLVATLVRNVMLRSRPCDDDCEVGKAVGAMMYEMYDLTKRVIQELRNRGMTKQADQINNVFQQVRKGLVDDIGRELKKDQGSVRVDPKKENWN